MRGIAPLKKNSYNFSVIPSALRSFDYFKPERVSEICKRFGWTEITNANRKDIFIGNIKRMQMDHSYKPVFLMSFLIIWVKRGAHA